MCIKSCWPKNILWLLSCKQNWRMRRSFKPAHSVILLAAVTVCVVLVAVTLLLHDLRIRELERSRLETQGLTQLFMRQTEHSFESADLVLQGVQERLQTVMGRQLPLDSEQIHLLLNTRAHALNATGRLLLVDVMGHVVNGSDKGPEWGVDVSNQSFFKAFQGNEDPGLYIDRPRKTQEQGLWTLNLARRIEDSHHALRGVIVVAIQIDNLEQIFSRVKLAFERPVSIYLEDGTLVASSPHRENLLSALAPELSREVLPIEPGELKLIHHQSGDGGRVVYSLGRVKGFPFLISVMNDEGMALASWRETSVPIGLGALLMMMAILSMAGYLMREIKRDERMAMALQEAHGRYHHTVESVMDAIVGIDESQVIQLFNPAAEIMFKMTSKEVLGQPLTLLLPCDMRQAHVQHVKHFASSDGLSRSMAPRLDVMGRRSDGTEFPIESTISKTLLGGEVQMTAVLRDVTERRKAEAELRNMNQQLRKLSASLQDVREQEKFRISRELHDDLGQQLTGLKLELAWLSSRIKEGRDIPLERMSDMKHMIDVAVASVRRISTELRPLILDDLGFMEAVAWQVSEVVKRSGLQIELKMPDHERVLDESYATAMFRIVQEALTNIVRHAQAKHVVIALTELDGTLCLRIQDDGVGMPEKIKSGGIGLVSMRERVHSLSGQFRLVEAYPGLPLAGVLIEVRLPFPAEQVAQT
jgi:PAS domain S-box-containing protein